MLRGKNKNRFALVLVLIIAASSGALAAYGQGHKTKKVATTPTSFKKLVAGASKDVQQTGDVKVDKSVSLVTYSISFQGVNVIISQQPLPQNLSTNVAFTQFTKDLASDSSFDTKYGTGYLFVPKDKTVTTSIHSAVLRTDDALIFARPASEIAVDKWPQLINSLTESRN